MPFVPRGDLEQLEAQNKALTAELSQFDSMAPHLALAQQIRDQIITVMDTNPDFSTGEIGEVAYRMVLDQQISQARDEVAAQYQQAHRRTLYDRLLGEVQDTEGEDISDRIRTEVETNPELATEIRESARQELAARAMDVVRGEVTAEQQVVIDEEAERQIELDRLDVKLAYDGELDLTQPEVKSQLKPGDRLVLYALDERGQKRSLVLEWCEDVNDIDGWCATQTDLTVIGSDGYEATIASSKFVTVGCIDHDLQQGDETFVKDLLKVGAPLAVTQRNKNGKEKLFRFRFDKYSYSHVSASLSGSDFQTKTLRFYS